MARFASDESVIISRDFDPDETGNAPTPNTATVTGFPPVAVTLVSGTVYTANLGRLPLGVWDVVWSDGPDELATTQIEVVGNLGVTLAEIRAGDPEFSDKVRFPADRLRAARNYVLEEFESITGLSFARRVSALALVSDGSGWLLSGLHGDVLVSSVTVDGVAATASDYSIDDNGIVEGPALSVLGAKVALTATWGLDATPEDVKRAVAIRVRSVVSQAASAIPDRATSVVSPDGGQMTLATPGRAGFETGIPEVDAILGRYTRKVARDLEGML